MHELFMFNNKELLKQSIIYPFYINNAQNILTYTNLKVLGGDIITLLSTEYIINEFKNIGDNSFITKRNALVDENQLSIYAIATRLYFYTATEIDALTRHGIKAENILASTFRALIGAYYIDNNNDIKAVNLIMEPLLRKAVKGEIQQSGLHSKNKLQEWVHKEISNNILPEYLCTQQQTKQGTQRFLAQVAVAGIEYGRGFGGNKQEAETEAAKNACIFANYNINNLKNSSNQLRLPVLY